MRRDPQPVVDRAACWELCTVNEEFGIAHQLEGLE